MKKTATERPLTEGLIIYEDKKVDCIVSYCANILTMEEMKEVSDRLFELSKNIYNHKNRNHVINS